ncbi:MAG: hypothetical protein ACRENP_04690, partial [Longimicrobiales bacterium]
MRSLAIFCVLTVAVAQTLAAQAERHAHGAHGTGLGEVTFANTGAPAAQEPFLRGLALLHSFEYE